MASDGTSLMLDPDLLEIQDLVEARLPTEITDRAYSVSMQGYLNSCRPESSGTTTLHAQEASDFLERLAGIIYTDLCNQANTFSPARWLWYLRRLPTSVFSGQLSSTLLYDEDLAEVCTQRGGPPKEYATVGKRIAYPVTEGIVVRVLRFCHTVKIFSNVHQMYRRAAKGTTFRLTDDDLEPVEDDALSRAIALYDQRMGGRRPVSGRAGTQAYTLSDSFDDPYGILGAGSLPDWQILPSLMWQLGDGPRPVRVFGRHVPVVMSMEALPKLYGTAGIGVRNERALAGVLFVMRVAYETSMEWRNSWVTLTRYGYYIVPTTEYERMLERAHDVVLPFIHDLLPDAEFGVLSPVQELIKSIKGRAWPLQLGPIVRSEARHTLVDLRSATRLLDSLLSATPGGGPASDARARNFEQFVQRIIDASPWAPPAGYRQLIGRTLRYGGKSVTDLDAIALRDGCLLAVSCKSLAYNELYDQGEYNVVRNRASDIADAIGQWNSKMDFLRSNPMGDNYDVSGVEILGLVVTPFPVYVPLGDSTVELRPGLRAACSVGELADYLGSAFDR